MAKTRLAYTPGTIGRIQGADPPLLDQDFLGDTQIALFLPGLPTGNRVHADPHPVTGPEVVVGVKSDLFNIESPGAVNIRNRYRYKFKFHLHLLLPPLDAPLEGTNMDDVY